MQEALHVIQNLEEQQACGADLNGHRSNSNGQAEEWDSRLLGRTLTGDTIEGQIYPDSRVPLLQLHSELSARSHLALNAVLHSEEAN